MEPETIQKNGASPKSLMSRKNFLTISVMAKSSAPRPNNGPSTTGRPSGSGRGNNPPAPKATPPKGK
jgi:hypothetical protein